MLDSDAFNRAVAKALVVLSFMTQLMGPVGAKEKPGAIAKPDAAVIECQRMLDAGKKEECEHQLADRLRIEPNNLDVRKLHAEALYQLGRFHYSVDELKVVLAARPCDVDANLLMGKALQSMHRPIKAVDSYEKFIALAPADQRTQQYKTLVRVLRDNNQTQGQQTAQSRAQAGNYLAAVASGAFAKWREPSAIRVYIKDGVGLEGYRPEFEEALRQAFDDWNESTNQKIGFIFITEPQTAQMTVTWTSDLHSPALKAEAGLAQTSYGADGIEKSEILLLTVDPFKDGPIGKNHLYNICLHEIGHALGLQGHSPHTEDIMGTTLYTQQGLSDRDVNTMLALYDSDRKDTADLPTTDEYGRPLSAAVKASHLSRAGSAAAAAGRYREAIDKLEAALKLNPADTVAQHNIAVAANNLAIDKATERDAAISLLHLALFWSQNDDAARQNLKSLLQATGNGKDAFALHLATADACLANKDRMGAIVEFREALAIKNDPAVRTKLAGMKE